ncbi:hypothetical protein BGW80DRAFT_1459355 [Lactifluus volemus]|nr:hypothetical protein BGW80DRAFT_1459355 [Lactifluus volemus]
MSNSSEHSRRMEATAEDPTPPPAEGAGPLSHINYESLENLLVARPPNPGSEENSERNGEQPLESHEVMELQAFSERKEWIIDKIKLLEGMPPIELFTDLDAVRASVPAVSRLPTREQLKQWIIEHDKIEKETEIFDSGELKKFKEFTKAASKRNLSSQDTDIIELTLTTIYEFDKLLHLLRGRSENLDLLGRALQTSRGSSREAAQFAGRISSLRHGKITAAGKALDKLIDNSRTPVPDELLDEQDKLEEQGINEMENVGRFIMSVVTQWRRQASAQHLLDDIDAAQLGHPSPRQDSVFSSRASTIVKRLSSREKPSSTPSSFLRPIHALFPDQSSANDAIIKLLGEELQVGLTLARRLERNVLEYHAVCEAVRTAEHCVVSANELSDTYDSVLHRMLNGVESSDGDGSPPDLTSELCLRETKHAAFLAHLPSLSQQLDKSDEETRNTLATARASLLMLGDINVEPDFKDRLVSAIRRLENVKADSDRTRRSMTERVKVLRHARKIWISADSILSDLRTIRGEMGDLMEQQKWKASTTSSLPPTPDSSHGSLPLSIKTLENATEQITLLQASFTRDVQAGISTLPGTVGPGLRLYLVNHRVGLSTILDDTQQMIRLVDNVRKQALVVTAIRDETHDFQVRLEDIEGRFDVLAGQILDGSLPDEDLGALRQDLASDATSIQTACQTFMNGLPHRVIFVSSDASGTLTTNASSPSLRRRFPSSLELTLEALQSLRSLDPPIDLAHLDHVFKIVNLDVVQDARAVDLKLATLRDTVTLAEERLHALRDTVSAIPDTFHSIDRLASLASQARPAFDAQRSEISRSLSPIRQLLHSMDVMCSRNPTSRPLFSSRSQVVDDMETKFHVWSDNTKAVLSDIRQREERLRAAQREHNKRERLEAEALRRNESRNTCAENKPNPKREEPTPSHAFPRIVDDTSVSEDKLDHTSEDLVKVQSRVAALRLRLQSLGVNAAAKPSPSSVSPLRTIGQHDTMASQIAEVSDEVMRLPAHTSNNAVDAELKSLQDELDASRQLLPRVLSLARFGSLIQDCDAALSDLLEHIDSYPAPPSDPLHRIMSAPDLVDQLEEEFAQVAHEPKASSERQRIVQTWAELESMAIDRINGRRSRPGSAISSGRSSRASIASHRPVPQKKSGHYSALSVSGPSRGRGEAPTHPSTLSRKVSHNAPLMPNRSSSRLSVVSTNRSVSGPNMASSSRLFSSTFASRQRTISLSSTTSNSVPNNSGRKSVEPSLLQPFRAGHARRATSPTPSVASVASVLFPAPAPDTSIMGPTTSIVLSFKPTHVAFKKQATTTTEKTLPEDVDIKVEVAQERGKTKVEIMVRVGGGWMELSKFIQTHFADMFRLFPEPMPYLGSREEKWISSSTLLEAPELISTPPGTPQPPEPGSGDASFPSFTLSTPSGRSPRSIQTHSSPGSPLTALQFLRRVDGEDSFLRPSTPSKTEGLLAPAVGASQPGINLAGGPELPPIVNNIDVSGVRPPVGSRGAGQFSTPAGPSLWNHGLQQHTAPPQTAPPVRQPFVASDRSFRLSASERSNSAQEVEELLGSQGRVQRKASHQGGWGNASHAQQQRCKASLVSS